jgi:hypothetical protein
MSEKTPLAVPFTKKNYKSHSSKQAVRKYRVQKVNKKINF